MPEARIRAHRYQKIIVSGTIPPHDLNVWARLPGKRPSGRRLVQSVDPNRIVRSRSAETIAPERIGNVSIRPGIDQELLAALTKNQAQGVGVTVPGVARTEGAGVDNHLNVPAGHDNQAAIGISCGVRPWRVATW